MVNLSALAEDIDDLLIDLSWFQEQCRQVSAQTVKQQHWILRTLRKVVEKLGALVEEENRQRQQILTANPKRLPR